MTPIVLSSCTFPPDRTPLSDHPVHIVSDYFSKTARDSETFHSSKISNFSKISSDATTFLDRACLGVVTVYVMSPSIFRQESSFFFPENALDPAQPLSVGSGIVLGKGRYILTTEHLLPKKGDQTEIYIQAYSGNVAPPSENSAPVHSAPVHSAPVHPATIVWRDKLYDMALLKITTATSPHTTEDFSTLEALKALPWAHTTPHLGEPIWSISTLNGLPHSVSKGVVACAQRDLSFFPTPLIQLDLVSAPGSSGGVLLNSQGQIIGMIIGLSSKIPSVSSITLAIPTSVLKERLQEHSVPAIPLGEAW